MVHRGFNQEEPAKKQPRSLLRSQIGVLRPVISETRNRMRKTTKRIFAIPAAVPAIPAKPRTPAMIATIKNAIAHETMVSFLLFVEWFEDKALIKKRNWAESGILFGARL